MRHSSLAAYKRQGTIIMNEQYLGGVNMSELRSFPDKPMSFNTTAPHPGELADFMQRFVDEADAHPLASVFGSKHYYSSQINLLPVRWVGGTSEVPDFALIRNAFGRRPQDPDEPLTILNMRSGRSARFVHSQIERVRQGQYSGDLARVATLDREDIQNDPIVALTTAYATEGSNYIGPKQPLVLRNSEQVSRLTALLDVAHPALEGVPVILHAPSAKALVEYLTQYLGPTLHPHIRGVELPMDAVSLTVTATTRFSKFIKNLIETAPKVAGETHLSDCIDMIDLNGQEEWDVSFGVRLLLENAVTAHEDGTYETNAMADLFRRVAYRPYDALKAIYGAAEGSYMLSTSSSGSLESNTVIRKWESLDENKATLYAQVFEDMLMPSVEDARQALHIPKNIPPTEQIMQLLKKHYLIETGRRITEQATTRVVQPAMTAPQWGEVYNIIDRTGDADFSVGDQETLQKYGLDVEALRQCVINQANIFPETVIRAYLEGAVAAFRISLAQNRLQRKRPANDPASAG